jgi:hypothetical protein
MSLLWAHRLWYTLLMIKTVNGRVLDRLLEPVSSSLNEEAARKLVGLKADRKTQALVAKLARKCNEGELTPEERAEYEFYVMAGEFIAVLQAKARILLARRGRSA